MTDPQTALQRYLDRLDQAHAPTLRVSLLLVLFIGFVLRLYSWEVGEAYRYFTINDEIGALRKALEFLAGQSEAFYIGQPAFAGGRAPGPVWTLFTVGAYLLGFKTIQGALFVMVLFNTATIYLVYVLARQFFTPSLALFSAVIFATAPWPVYYAVGFYNPIALTFFSALLFIALRKVSVTHRSAHIVWVFLLAAVLPQFHMIAIFYVPAILLVLVLMPAKLNWRWAAVGILAGMAVYLPYMIGDALNGWQNTRAMLQGGPEEFSPSVVKILSAPITVLSNALGRAAGDDFSHYQQLGNRFFIHYGVLLAINLFSFLLCGALFVRYGYAYIKGLLSGAFGARANHASMNLFFVGSLLFLPLLLFVPTGHNYASRYTLIALPLLFLLPALAVRYTAQERLAAFLKKTFLVLALVNIYIVIALYSYKAQLLAHGPSFMPSFNTLETIEEEVREIAAPDTRIEVTYARSIRRLPEGEFKLYRAVEAYLNMHPGDSGETVRLRFDLPREGQRPPSGAVYSSPHLIISQAGTD